MLALLFSCSSANVRAAFDLISRNFGSAASASFDLSISTGPCNATAAPCFSLSESGSKVSITASSMSELTYGIGFYTRYYCGLTVGRDKWGGSHTNSSDWPCHGGALKPVSQARAVPYTYQDNVCTHSYSYVWYGESEWTQHIDQMALQGVNVFLALTGQEEIQYKVHTSSPLRKRCRVE